MAEPQHSIDLASYLRGQADSEIRARVSALEEWRETLEGYAKGILTYLWRGVVVLMVWALLAVTNAFPESIAARLAVILGRLLDAF